MEIIGQNDEPVHIFSNSINAPVLYFRDTNELTLKNLKIGHSGILNKEYVGCGPDGDVLQFHDCNDVLIESSFLYGCGTQGIDFWSGKRITIKDSEIYDCTNGIISLDEVFDVLFENCTFKDNQITSRSFFNINKTENLKILNSKIENNIINDKEELLFDENNIPVSKYLFFTKSGNIENYITVNGRLKLAEPTKVETTIELVNTSITGNEVDYLANQSSNIVLKKITYGSPDNKFRKQALYPNN